jgi:uncharacterized membrane-anchored protein
MNSPQPIKPWRFWIPLFLQTALIISIPAQAVYIHLTGKTIILQTAPVDPYDFLRGYSQTLGYDISNYNNLEILPGGKETFAKVRRNSTPSDIYVVLETPAQQVTSGRPKPWKAVKISDRPLTLTPNQIAIKGLIQYNRITYNLESYYFPEDQREQFNNDINAVQRGRLSQPGKAQPFVVEAKVDSQGNAVPVSLWIGDRNYRF